MTVLRGRFAFLAVTLLVLAAGCSAERLSSESMHTGKNVPGMVRTSRKTLAPVYAPLAEQLVSDLNLREKEGIGIDLGSGPGTLILELCERTGLHWINADINPDFFPQFFEQAIERGFGGRVSAIFADAHSLPFHDDYADVIISRGSFPFWEDKTQGFHEICRVLKPGAVAYIGRGFSRNLPVETARTIRAKQGKKMKYDRTEAAEELHQIMIALNIETFRIHRPAPVGSEDVNYGVWVEFHKPVD
ncbi:MAG: class I SAM-dependent methyltransferase [Planctomycetota bacterium]